MRNKYLKPFNVDLYNELFDSSTPFQVVNGKDEPVDIINTEVTINGESGNVLYQTVDGSYFTVDRNGKHAKDPTFCDLYIKTPPPYKPDDGVNSTNNLEYIKEIMYMVTSGTLYGMDVSLSRIPSGDIVVDINVLENEEGKVWGNFRMNSREGMEQFKSKLFE